MGELNTLGRPIGKRAGQWLIGLVLLGLLGLTQIQCSETSSQTPSTTTSSDNVVIPTPQAAVALASDSPSIVKVSTPLLASNETFTKVAKDAMASVVNISATKRATMQGPNNPFFDDPFSAGFLGKNLSAGLSNHGNGRNKASAPVSL